MQTSSTLANQPLSPGRAAFPPDDVLPDNLARQLRQFNLKRAQTLGNGYQRSVTITYLTASREAQTLACAVASVSNSWVTLKNGARLPTHAILSVEF